MSSGAKASNQSRQDQGGGAQLVGKPPSAPIRKVPAFMGGSGTASAGVSPSRGSGGK